jgi:hypothetical protein
MNARIQKYKDDFLKQQEITYRRIYVSNSENEKLLKRYNKSEEYEEEIRKNYKVDEDSVVVGNIRFYTEESESVTEEEINQYISMKIINRLDNLDEKVDLIKNIMIFWVILSIVGMIGAFLIATY